VREDISLSTLEKLDQTFLAIFDFGSMSSTGVFQADRHNNLFCSLRQNEFLCLDKFDPESPLKGTKQLIIKIKIDTHTSP
jgi:hypothetical protein